MFVTIKSFFLNEKKCILLVDVMMFVCYYNRLFSTRSYSFSLFYKLVGNKKFYVCTLFDNVVMDVEVDIEEFYVIDINEAL